MSQPACASTPQSQVMTKTSNRLPLTMARLPPACRPVLAEP